MAILQPSDLIKMDYSFEGQPFVSVPANSGINLLTMDFSFNGQPFVANIFASEPPVVSGGNMFLLF